ncbi:uncharacterized protein A1O9_01872 [Exophiala aquamarina CBS 119918]|uniref:Enoyl reductase (ER) domain-containing protein n=1 Tax=Exophiala aquamarina CBS 119918 TaxID=1182545 RepID=A0A072PKR4_9EURO|nr:uncharacterized protein A1O9_01872 [Exophiala aquamarina CBS 119918]KEF60312.1 hypothetical protein A1O9_01872 [Exophiala aquamarina CBS 119918]
MIVIDGTLSATLPITASHEGSGFVIEVGSAVENFKAGDRAMSGVPLNPCGHCEDCRGPEDQVQYCKHTTGAIGLGVDGAFSDYHVADSRTTCLIPDNVNLAEGAALACAGCTIYCAVKTSRLVSGGFLAIVGAGGGLGHLGVQFARVRGIQAIGIDAQDAALGLCTTVGANYVIDAREGQETPVAKVQEIAGASGADATLNLSAHSTATVTSCAVTRCHGTMMQVACPQQTTISIFDLVSAMLQSKIPC